MDSFVLNVLHCYTLQNIEKRVGQLADHPFIGRQARVVNTRELVVAGTPYIVAYRVGEKQVDILAVLHGAMRWPEVF